MKQKTHDKFGPFQFLILVLSIYVIIALLIDTLIKLPHEISKILSMVDNFIFVIFLVDFINRFYKAENKWKFMRWGWIDLLSSIPTLEVMRAGRLLRVVRLLRLLRAFRSMRILITHLYAN